MPFLRFHQALNLAQMSMNGHYRPTRVEAVALGVKVPVKRVELDSAFDAGLFVRLTRRSLGVGCISVNPTFGKRPPAAASAHQKKLRLIVLEPIANCCNMNAFAC